MSEEESESDSEPNQEPLNPFDYPECKTIILNKIDHAIDICRYFMHKNNEFYVHKAPDCTFKIIDNRGLEDIVIYLDEKEFNRFHDLIKSTTMYRITRVLVRFPHTEIPIGYCYSRPH